MKIAFVFGKGLDGCGVEKVGYEWQRYDPQNIHVYSLAERSFVRSGGHIKNSISFKPNEIPTIAKKLNDEYDIVVLNSYPSPMHARESVVSFYKDLVLKLEKPIIVSMMHEIKRANFDRIPMHLAIANASDFVFNFSTKTDYSVDVSKVLTNKKIGERIARMKLPFTVSDYDKYVIPFEQKDKRIIYTGRWTTMKDPARLIDLYPLRQDLNMAIHGIERSIGAKFDIIDRSNYKTKFEKYDDSSSIIQSFGPYEYQDGMKLLSSAMFGYSGFRLPREPHNYGDRFEYTQMEMMAVGSIAMFDKHYGENNIDDNGKRFIDNPQIAVWSDREDLQDTMDQLLNIATNKVLYEQYVEASRAFVRQETDASIVIPKMLEHITKFGKQTDKWTHNQLLEKCYGQDISQEFEAMMNEYTPALGCKEVEQKSLSYFVDKKRIVMKSLKAKAKATSTGSLEEFF